MKHFFIISFFCLCLFACKKTGPRAPADEDLLDGPVEGLSSEEKDQFLKGDRAFNNAIFTKENGLGPIFVATSCGGCHAGDGKGHPFTSLTRFGQTDSSGNQFLHLGGPQLQNRALPGMRPETLPPGISSSKFLPPANTGLGYLDAVSDADLLAMADPFDADGDGISGIPNWVSPPAYCDHRKESIEHTGRYIGRFGRKGAAYDLLQQTANAYNQDMGVNSSFEPIDTYTHEKVDAEVSNTTVQQVVFYLRTLKAPIQRDQAKTEVKNGKNIFVSIGCENCHKAQLKTSDAKLSVLANKTFYPYTDLLLHDMGTGLDDGYTEGSAKTYEWRTPALWGLGLAKTSQGGTYYLMHDGRANSIEAAILLHGGEGEKSKINFEMLSPLNKKNLLIFLESL
jgi:CxxC motif-containing protein (DUF1111 family)